MRVLYFQSRILPLALAAVLGLILAAAIYPWVSLFEPGSVPAYSEGSAGRDLGPLIIASEKSETAGSMLWMILMKGALPAYKAPGERHYVVELLSYATNRIRANEPHRILAMGVAGLSQVSFMPAVSPITTTPDIPPVTDPGPGTSPGPGPGTDITQGHGNNPLIVIYHTHNSESFVPDSGQTHVYENPEVTIVRVGLELVKELEALGASVIHSAKDHVRPVFDQSYTRSLETVNSILRDYSSVDYVFDVHRDGVARNLTTTIINGQEVARVYIVVGTNEKLSHPNWRENYAFALELQQKFDELYPGFSRGILLRPLGRYNQHVHPNAMLIEIGGHENTMEEAIRATRYLAECIMALDAKRTPKPR